MRHPILGAGQPAGDSPRSGSVARDAGHRPRPTARRLWPPALCALLAGCLPTPRAVYDFDDGTTQGWKVTGAVHDDQGKAYTPMLFAPTHSEAAQYPTSLPMGDPLTDKKGALFLNGFQFGPWATMVDFPKTAKYWTFSTFYSGLDARGSTAWQGIKGVRAALGDMYGALPGHVTASLGVRARVAGQDQLIREVDAAGSPVFHPVNFANQGKWSYVTSPLSIPANAQVYMVFIEFRGAWAGANLYEGGIFVDAVEPVK